MAKPPSSSHVDRAAPWGRAVFLVGMMGSGKTTIGKGVARELSRPFVDLDAYIEAREGRAIAELFAQGEAHFRDCESQALVALATRSGRKAPIVATGGGAAIRAENRAVMADRGLAIFLDVDVDALVSRLASPAQRRARPLLAALTSREELRQRIEDLLAQRRSSYEACGHRIDAAAAPDRVVASIRELVGADAPACSSTSGANHNAD